MAMGLKLYTNAIQVTDIARKQCLITRPIVAGVAMLCQDSSNNETYIIYIL